MSPKTPSTRTAILSLILLATIANLSCKKDQFQESDKKWIENQTTSLVSDEGDEGGEWYLSVPYPTATNVEAIFQEDVALLRSLVRNPTLIKADVYTRSLADKIAGYYYHKKSIDLRNDFSQDPTSVIVFGLLFAAKEVYDREMQYQNYRIAMSNEYGTKANVTPNLMWEPSFDCFLTAVSSVIGLSEVQSLWRSIVAGATEQSVIAALKLMGRRVASVITVGMAVYQAGKCLGWWGSFF